MQDQLEQIIDFSDESVVVRIYQSDKKRLDALQRRLTIQSGGQFISHPKVLRYLLDLAASSKSNNTVNNG